METKKYIFSLDYGNRMEEKEFIKAVLREFDSNTLVGCGIFVNNNPYCLELLFFASLEKDTDRFEDFMKKHFNDKQRVFNYFFDDIIESFYKRGYNVKTFIEADEVDFIITDEPNGLFLFPSKEIVNKIWGSNREIKRTPKVFLSHSSKDKEIVTIFPYIKKDKNGNMIAPVYVIYIEIETIQKIIIKRLNNNGSIGGFISWILFF
jgi:hypothetical protein